MFFTGGALSRGHSSWERVAVGFFPRGLTRGSRLDASLSFSSHGSFGLRVLTACVRFGVSLWPRYTSELWVTRAAPLPLVRAGPFCRVVPQPQLLTALCGKAVSLGGSGRQQWCPFSDNPALEWVNNWDLAKPVLCLRALVAPIWTGIMKCSVFTLS